MKKIISEGSLEVICGPMFAGKTEELLRILNRLKYAKINFLIFKPLIDSRAVGSIASRNGQKMEAIEIKSASEILTYIMNHPNIDCKVVAIDEAQFFDQEIIDVCLILAHNNYHVIISGLDKNFKGEPFGYMPELMVYADKITKLSAICMQCGCEARYSQRLLNGKPADYNSELVLIGDYEHYESRCLKHFEVKNKPMANSCVQFNNYFKNKKIN